VDILCGMQIATMEAAVFEMNWKDCWN
jgi:hypothetical protein